MSERRSRILAAALRVFQDRGPHGLTHRAVDKAAKLPPGSTSNLFRTRRSLLTALAEEIAVRRLAEGAGPHDERLTLAWLELLIEARRDPSTSDAIAPTRQQMIALLEANRSDTLALSTPEVAALLTGIEFAEATTGVRLSHLWHLLATTDQSRAGDGADGATL